MRIKYFFYLLKLHEIHVWILSIATTFRSWYKYLSYTNDFSRNLRQFGLNPRILGDTLLARHITAKRDSVYTENVGAIKKQNLRSFSYLIVLIPLLISCSAVSNLLSSKPEILIRKDFDGNGVAVLSFSKSGNLPNEIGKLAADKLTDALFLNSKLSVIDRARVNDAQAGLEIASTEFLSAEQIQKLGQKLKANYLILGRVQSISEENFFEADKNKQLIISFRIVSASNQDVVGIVNYSRTYDEKLLENLNEMIEQIALNIIESE